MKLRRRPMMLALGVSLLATPALATPVSEDIQLAAIVTSLGVQIGQFSQMIDAAMRGVDTATATLQTTRELVAAVDSTVYLVRNPDEVLNDARFDYLTTFPELQAFAREAQALNDQIHASPTGFDSGAYVRAFRSTKNSYQMWMALDEDHFGMAASHQRAIAHIEQLGDDAVALQGRLAAGNLNMRDLTAITAQATVNLGEAIAASAEQESEVVRIERIRYLEEQEQKYLAQIAIETTSRGRAENDALKNMSSAQIEGVAP